MTNLSGVAFTVRIPGDLHAKLSKMAWRRRSSMNQEINAAIRAHLDADKHRRAAK